MASTALLHRDLAICVQMLTTARPSLELSAHPEDLILFSRRLAPMPCS